MPKSSKETSNLLSQLDQETSFPGNFLLRLPGYEQTNVL